MKTAGISDDVWERASEYLTRNRGLKISALVSLALDRLLDELETGALWEDLTR